MISLSNLSQHEREQLKLSSPESFALFTEGLQALADYEKTARREKAELSSNRLETCVMKYPQDVLPRFYLGIAKSYLGGLAQQDAIRHFQSVQQTSVNYLRLAANYNLAAAFIFEYTGRSLERAEAILKQTKEELETVKSPELYFPVWIDLLWVTVRQRLWWKVTHGQSEGLQPEFDELGKDLRNFNKAFTRAKKKIPEADVVLADFRNVEGLFFESKAHFEPVNKLEHAETAEAKFGEALRIKAGWPAAKANLARVYIELLGQLDTAIDLLFELTKGVEQVEYSHYLLGQAFSAKGQHVEAVRQFRQATKIPEAWLCIGKVLRDRKRFRSAKRAFRKVLDFEEDSGQTKIEAREELTKLGG